MSRAVSRAELGRLLAPDDLAADLVWAEDRYGVLHTQVPGEDAEQLWWHLRDLVGVTGRWPVVRGSIDQLIGGLPGPRPKADLARAEGLDLKGWFDDRARELDLETGPLNLAAVAVGRRYSGWYFFSAEDTGTEEFFPRVELVLVPDARPWAAAAYVGFGAWNECPEPAVHVALMHEWYDRWGAEPFAFVDALQAEMYVARPPRSAKQAAALAQQHYVYAYDNIVQGDGNRASYASALIGYQSWQFWWD